MQALESIGVIVGFILIILVIILASSIKVIQEYERAVIFRFGRAVGVRGPGVILVIPGVEQSRVNDIRIRVIEIPRQEVMTVDNVPVSTNAICFYNIIDAEKSIIEVQNYQQAVYQLAQATTRSVVGESHLDEVLSNRDDINDKIRRIIGDTVSGWGLHIEAVEIKDVELPNSMKRAMARQAEAERDKRGRIIQAEGEETAAALLAAAALTLRGHPEGLHLRTLQTLTEIGAEHNTNSIIVIPVEVLKAFEKTQPIK